MTTSWAVLSGYDRTPYTCDPITHHAYRERVMMPAEEVADVRDRRAQRTGVPYGNMRAKLPDYIGQVFECKADSPYYSAGASHTGGAGRASRDVQTPVPICRAFPARLARLA
jgi:hypothetical protein